ncbi:DUF1961 family protein [Namhaeicola litoreus]|uniref:DUF1961 family protein n=1 Tax=Namhaeicola litoreus TaxID=1052145 RepID=A0ABW3Y749_9FLAO
MKKYRSIKSKKIGLFFLFLWSISAFSQIAVDEIVEFKDLIKAENWTLSFEQNINKKWQEQWFLDGKLAKVVNKSNGFLFSAGPKEGNDSHHAVLWTNDSFEGNVKVEFDFTKKDTMNKYVVIIYLQATGKGVTPYEKDISKWNDLRKVPSMSTYFNNMNALHISYAAFSNGKEYVRARRYPVTNELTFKDLVIDPSYDDLKGIFKTDVTYHITVLKTKEKLFFKVQGDDKDELFCWDLTLKEPIIEGRVGLRHMFARSAFYENFKIYSQK